MKSEYGFKLENLVNNLKGNECCRNEHNCLRHTINKDNYCLDAQNFYVSNRKLMIDLAEDNIKTISDLNNYENWIESDEL